MRTELEEQKVFPMKAHLHHVKEHKGTMALNFSTDDYLFFVQVMEEQPVTIYRVHRSLGIAVVPSGWLWTDPATLGVCHFSTGGCLFPKSRAL